MERNAPVEGGGYRCDTLCCILNCSLELLCLLLILGTFFLPAFSVDASAKNALGALGVCDIENPEYYDGGNVGMNGTINTAQLASIYNRLYFGTAKSPYSYDIASISNQPIYWRVLNTTANNDSKTPALFMLTEYCTIPQRPFDSSSFYYSNSEIRRYLSDTILPNFFTKEEQSSLMPTTKTTGEETIQFYNNSSDYVVYGHGLNQDKLFLLSVKELINTAYGFSNFQDTNHTYSSAVYACDVNRFAKQYCSQNSSAVWWIRSHTYGYPCITIDRGQLYDTRPSDLTVRFALNIPLNKILFAQDANTQSTISSHNFNSIPSSLKRTIIAYDVATPSNPETIITIGNTTSTEAATPGYIAAGAKLTIVDDSRDFAVDNTYISTEAGSTINLHYTGATVGDGEYISAIIKQVGTKEDGTGTGIYGGDGLYHARLKAVGNSTSGNVTMTIPQDLPLGEYTLIVYNELERGAYKTNYAGYDTLMLTVKDLTNPTVTNVYRNKLGDSFKLTASDENLSHISTLEDQEIINLSGTNTTKNFLYGKSINGINIYDISGNATTVYASDIPIDKTPPSVTVSYTNGTYNLTVSDSESGVWKITNSDGDTIYRDYSTSNNSATI